MVGVEGETFVGVAEEWRSVRLRCEGRAWSTWCSCPDRTDTESGPHGTVGHPGTGPMG